MKWQVRVLTINALLVAVMLAAFASTTFAEPAKKPLKIFILAGQSNMVGIADVRTLPSLSTPPFRPTLDQVRQWGTFDRRLSAINKGKQ